jgi:hypothetical protein
VFIPMMKSNKKKSLAKAIREQCRNGDKMVDLKLHKISNEDSSALILDMEQKLLNSAYKFGVLYCRAGQTHEDQMVKKVTFSGNG